MKKQQPTAPEKQEIHEPQPVQLPLDVRIKSLCPEGKIKAFASMNIAGQFAIDNIKIVEGEKGTFVSMPSMKDGKGQYRDICFPVTAEFRNQINSAVMGAYKQELEKIQSHASEQAQSSPAMAM